MTIPLVSILCITYNHAPYIRQCLDGFVMQKTSFPTEVIIHDDASTDGTADIIREYEQKYPEIFKPIYQTENQYSKGIPIFRTYIFPQIQGKYMALCEGDDYWIDEYKIQKQVDFLEANEDFSICFHPVKVFKQDEGIFIENIIPEVPEVTDIKTLAAGNYINTPSVMYRVDKKVFEDINNFPVLPVGDYLFHMLFAKNGKIKKLPDTMAVYRIHNNSTWSTKSIGYRFPIWLKLLEALLVHFTNNKEVSKILKEHYINIAFSLIDFYFKNNDLDSQKKLCTQVKNQLDETSYLFYNKVIDNLNCEINSIKSSKSYRLGRILLTPLRALKNLLMRQKWIKRITPQGGVCGFCRIKKYFLNKTGLEIGGPSGAFRNNGYLPVYEIMGALDGINFSSSTVWTGSIEENKGFIIDGKNTGKMYIADATDLNQIKNNAYDFVLSSNNIEHIANPMKAIEQWISKLKKDGVLVIVAPRKEVNFDHKRDTVKFTHLLEDYNNGIDEHDLTHLEEILKLHDLPMDPPAGTFEQFKERSLKNYENRCLHHHVFDLKVLKQMCGYFKLKPILMSEKKTDYIIVTKNIVK